MSADDVAQAFVAHFYSTLDSGNAAALGALYQPTSTLSFEGASFTGVDAIVGKYASLGAVVHDLAGLTREVQLSVNASSMLIFVTGKLIIGGPTGNPLLFSQCFQLVAVGPGQYYVNNDFFRLIYA